MIVVPVPRGFERVTSQMKSAWLAGSLSLALVGGVVAARAQQGPVPPTPVATATADPAATVAFAGKWDYNPAESVNAANGRPEQNPNARRTPTPSRQPSDPRTGGGGGSNGGGSSGGGSSGGGSSGGGSSSGGSSGGGGGYPGGGAGSNPTGAGDPGTGAGGGAGGYGPRDVGPAGRGRMMAIMETRELVRDLLEVPELLTFKVTPEAVTVVDDLGRERVYPTDNKKRKYQFGAAVFDARARWDGAVFKKEIEAARGFKMFETYFLSDDGNRLFVIVRIGPQSKNAPVVGVNRVYDRQRRP
jgi:hypothetical protein